MKAPGLVQTPRPRLVAGRLGWGGRAAGARTCWGTPPRLAPGRRGRAAPSRRSWPPRRTPAPGRPAVSARQRRSARSCPDARGDHSAPRTGSERSGAAWCRPTARTPVRLLNSRRIAGSGAQGLLSAILQHSVRRLCNVGPQPRAGTATPCPCREPAYFAAMAGPPARVRSRVRRACCRPARRALRPPRPAGAELHTGMQICAKGGCRPTPFQGLDRSRAIPLRWLACFWRCHM
jgi:hypothetical protein